jgi:hypothetical protein
MLVSVHIYLKIDKIFIRTVYEIIIHILCCTYILMSWNMI